MNNHRGILWQALALVAFLGGCDNVSDIANGTSGKGGASGTGGKVTGSGGKGAAGSGSGGTSSAGGAVSTGGNNGTGGSGSGTAGSAGNAGGSSGDGGSATAGSGAGGSAVGGTKATGGSGAGGSAVGGSGAGGSAAGGASGSGGSSGVNCTMCHGDPATNNPAPPQDTSGNTDTASAGVGAHSKHLSASTWHRQTKCTDCHLVPTSKSHANGKIDFNWTTPANADSAKPAFDTTALTCTGTYCHGTTLAGASSAKTTPVWNQVNGTWSACGTACHMTPPPASSGHPASTACETCHSKVIASFKAGAAGAAPTVVWKDSTLHVNGTVEVDTLTCTSCHGTGTNAAPPKDTQGNTATSAAGVGSHAQHLGTSTWHRQGQCGDCHTTPTSTAHSNGKVDFTWGGPSNADGATSSFSTSNLTCTGNYCHGSKMTDQAGSIVRAPVWNKVDGTQDACGKSCHATPPASSPHNASTTACQNCHGAVISNFNGANSTWKDATKHINGTVEATAAACGSCHGIPPTNKQVHTESAHTPNNCGRCHPSDTAPTHNNGTVNVSCSMIPGYRVGASPCHSGD